MLHPTPRRALLGLVLIASAVALAPASLRAQAEPAAAARSATPVVVQALLRDLAQAERKLVGLAEAIPEESYGWHPAEGVRSVGEVLMHVAADNYFLPTVADVAAPEATGIAAGDYASVQAYERRPASKAEALAAVRESFAHLRAAMERTDEALLTRQLTIFGSEMSGTELWILTATHLHEHLGQLIAYARANDVVPPWSRGD